MRYVAAYLLAALSGNADPSTADIEKILSSVGIECNPGQLQKVMNELKGKDLEALISEGILFIYLALLFISSWMFFC